MAYDTYNTILYYESPAPNHPKGMENGTVFCSIDIMPLVASAA